MGNVSMDQRVVSPSTSNPWVSRSQDERGNWWTEDAAGRRAVSLLRNEGITSHQVSAKVSQSDIEAASRTASSAAADVVSAGTMRAATLSEALTRARQHTSSSRASAGQSFSGYQEVSRAAEQLTSESKRIATETGYSEDQVASALLRFQAIPSAYGIGGGAAVEKRYGVSLSEAEKKILDHSTASSYRAARSFGDRASTDRAFLNALSTEGQSGTSLASSLSSSATRSESAEQRYSEALARSEELRIAHEQGLSFTRDLAADPANSAAVVEYERAADMYRGSPQALAAHMASMLGNMSFTPTRFSSGTALPSSFGDVRSVHLDRANEPALNPDLASRRAANDQAVRAGPVANAPPAPAAGRPGSPEMPSPDPRTDVNPDLLDGGRFRAGVEGAQRSQDQASQQGYESFDGRHEIDRSRGGLATHQSMAGRAAGGLKRDAETTFDDATEAGRRAMEEAKQRAASSPRQKAIDATSEVPAMRPNSGKRSPDRH